MEKSRHKLVPPHHLRHVMKNALSALAAMVFAGSTAFATDQHAYKPDEYLVIGGGLSPDKRLSISAHGGPDEGDTGSFHLYLMDTKKHRKLAVLEEVTAWLDTGISAYTASWAPDSRHVAVYFRWDRNAWDLILYRVEDGKVIPVKGPELLDAALPDFAAKKFTSSDSDFDPAPVERTGSRTTHLDLKWLSPTRFELRERTLHRHVAPDPTPAFGAYAKCGKINPESPDYAADFSAEAVCEFTKGDRYRVVTIKPGTFPEE